MSCKYIALIIFYLSLSFLGVCQTTINIGKNKGDIVEKKVVINSKSANEIRGILAPFPNQKTQQYEIDAGQKMSFPAATFTNGIAGSNFPGLICINPNNPKSFDDSDSPLDLSLKLVNNHILLSVTVKDLKTGEIVGKIVDNKWVIKLSKNFAYASSRKYLEIVDNYGYVAFRVEVGSEGVIVLRGYFVGLYCSLFLTDRGMIVMSKGAQDYEDQKIKNASVLKPKYCAEFK